MDVRKLSAALILAASVGCSSVGSIIPGVGPAPAPVTGGTITEERNVAARLDLEIESLHASKKITTEEKANLDKSLANVRSLLLDAETILALGIHGDLTSDQSETIAEKVSDGGFFNRAIRSLVDHYAKRAGEWR